MTPSVLLPPGELAVEPGSTISTELRVRNTADIVDEFTFEPLGVAAEWITVEPAMVRLFPDTDAVVTVTIAPPRAPTTRPGVTPWAVRTVPRQHPELGAVAEGKVVVGTFTHLSAELQPASRHGRLRTKFELAVDNRGNVALPVRVGGTDAGQALSFATAPAGFDARPGTATFARLKVKPVDRIWRGQPKSHPFQVLVSAQPPSPASVAGNGSSNGHATDGEVRDVPVAVAPVVLDGTFVQEPVLPKWLLKAVLLAAALVLALFILWKTVLKPTFESAARAVVTEEVDAVDQKVDDLAESVDATAEEAAAAVDEKVAAVDDKVAAVDDKVAAVDDKVEAVDDKVDGSGGPGRGDGVLTDTSNPTNFRLTVQAAPGASGASASVPNPANATFALTDILLQNPSGDVGRIRVITGAPIMESALENFRDLDFHFISPYLVGPGAIVSIEVDYAVDQLVENDPCDAAVSFAGFTSTVAEEA